jgi:hypothetical protein
MTGADRAATFSWRQAGIAIVAAMAMQALILHLMGHPLLCACGRLTLWNGDPGGPQSSQQLTDWYSWTHLLHGFLFYALLRWLFPKSPFPLLLALAAGLEIGWEILENSPPIMTRYRQNALARGYFGDSIVNSLSDTVMALAGMLLAWRLPVRASIVFVLAVELWLALAIRDNLTLNVVELVWPNPALSHWQMRR